MVMAEATDSCALVFGSIDQCSILVYTRSASWRHSMLCQTQGVGTTSSMGIMATTCPPRVNHLTVGACPGPPPRENAPLCFEVICVLPSALFLTDGMPHTVQPTSRSCG